MEKKKKQSTEKQEKIIIKSPKKNTKATIIVAAIAVATIIILSGAIVLPKIDLRLIRTTKVTSSQINLVQMQKIAVFDTVEMTYKTVFPFDFLLPKWEYEILLSKYRNYNYTEEEAFYLKTVSLCQALGINPYKTDKFIVISTVLTAGYKTEDEDDIDFNKYISINENYNSIKVYLPNPIITNIQTLDFYDYSDKYPYFEVSPEEWKEIILHLQPKIKQMAIRDGIISHARNNAANKLKLILEKSQWDDIEIITD